MSVSRAFAISISLSAFASHHTLGASPSLIIMHFADLPSLYKFNVKAARVSRNFCRGFIHPFYYSCVQKQNKNT